jgi:hypothetical protein
LPGLPGQTAFSCLLVCFGISSHQSANFRADAGMKSVFKVSTGLIVGKNQLPHCDAVEFARPINNGVAESFANFFNVASPG